jgi:hypothetical protein
MDDPACSLKESRLFILLALNVGIEEAAVLGNGDRCVPWVIKALEDKIF